VVAVDIKALAPNEVRSLEPAFKKYNEEQFSTVKLPGSSEAVWSSGRPEPSIVVDE